MKKTLMILGVLFIGFIVYGATKKLSELDLATSLSSTDVFLVTRDSSSTDVSNGFTWKTLVNGVKDTIEANQLDLADSLTVVGIGTSGDIEFSNSDQIYGSKERFIKTVYIARPDTIPTDTAYVVDNFLGATITIDSIKVEHDADTVDFKVHVKAKGSTSRTTIQLYATSKDTVLVCTKITTPVTLSLLHNGSIGVGEIDTSLETDATFLKVTFIGTYTKAKIEETGRSCAAPV